MELDLFSGKVIEHSDAHNVLLTAEADFYSLRNCGSQMLGRTFQDYCVRNGVDTETKDMHFWHAASLFVGQPEWNEYITGKSIAEAALLALMVSTPFSLRTAADLRILHKLHGYNNQLPSHVALKMHASRFNALIRTAALASPDLNAGALAESLYSIGSREARALVSPDQADQVIRTSIRGGQHEVAFGQLLWFARRAFRPATASEDVHGHTDYLVGDGRGDMRCIDIKSGPCKHTPEEIFIRTETECRFCYYGISPDATIVLASLVRPIELRGRFFVDADIAVGRATVLNTLLDHMTDTSSYLQGA